MRARSHGSTASKPPRYCVIDRHQDCSRTTSETSESTDSDIIMGSNASQTHRHQQENFVSSLVLTEENVKAHLKDYYEDLHANARCNTREVWEALYEKYISPKYTLLRPSGNPLSYQGCIDILSSDDFLPLSYSLVSIDSVQIMAGGAAAVTLYTLDESFRYKGTLVEDRTVLTTVVEAVNGEIKSVFSHRCTGQPVPKRSRWEAA